MEAVTSPAAGGSATRSQLLVLVGFMGSGKTSAARSLAGALGAQPLDSDHELERRLGEPIESFFDREGEQAFRAREEELIVELLDDSAARVVALGGGALGSERVREAVARHTVVYLEVDPAVAWRRASGKGRPLARDESRFVELHEQRRPVYESVADVIVPPGPRGGAVRLLPALAALAQAPAGTRLVWASAASGEYPVFFGRGLIDAGFMYPAEAPFVVTDSNVAARHRVRGMGDAAIHPGETAKNLRSAEWVLRKMAEAGVGHDDAVAAVGGGVVGDLGGFCAAIYQRGIAHVQVPTTLVAQVDSAFGGKTGVDLPEGKNYAGAYHQPSAVIVDPSALETLPREELAAGYAEVVKTALIAGGSLWARVRDGRPVDDEMILGCIRTKLAVVAEDERDSGRRQILNLGHTVGHAIEAGTAYSRYRHGEAVGIGLLAALRLSGREQLRREVSSLLAGQGLPVTFEGPSAEEVAQLVQRDKKRRGGRVPFVLVQAPGDVTPGHDVPDDELLAAIAEVRA
ncbi:MAG: shikimate kinase / 3-dehydroquinate synthase [Thermoleophilaceae bacterium]|nr:shikimate kinase / 3-dehydroquinate synthase [Thermoleophilaceae bacterium]